MSDLEPVDITIYVGMIVRAYAGEWLTPQFIWDELQRLAPEIAVQVKDKVRTYKDPERNTAVWFISNTFDHLDKSPEFEMSTTGRHPEVGKPPEVWRIIRKRG